MSNQRFGMTIAARIAATLAYEQAIQTREHLDKLMRAVPINNSEQYQCVRDALDLTVKAINAAWYAKYHIEKLEEEFAKERYK